jgi:hypothetical protein
VRGAPSLVALLCAGAIGFAGCGGGGGGTSSSIAGAGEPAPSPTPTLVHHNDSGGAKQFEKKGSDNSIQEFGAEAGATERERATAVLHGYLDATARGDWPMACRYVSTMMWQQLAKIASLRGKGCVATLAAFFASVPAKNFADASEADVGSLRIAAGRGFLLYHGPHHTDYEMPMVTEQGRWKVAAAAGSALF